MGLLDGKVAFITGAARGQGRSHAVTLAAEGADIIAVDLCHDLETVPYPLAAEDDLAQTVREVRQLGRGIVAHAADVRDRDALARALHAGIDELGGVDIVLANAGVLPLVAGDTDPQTFHDTIAINLTGAWNTVEVAKAALIDRSPGGCVVFTGSTAGVKAYGGDSPGALAYVASKHALVGLARSYAGILAPHSIRVNCIHPTAVDTPMINNPAVQKWVEAEIFGAGSVPGNALPVRMIEPLDVSRAIVWLTSDHARYVTGVSLPVDAGFTIR